MSQGVARWLRCPQISTMQCVRARQSAPNSSPIERKRNDAAQLDSQLSPVPMRRRIAPLHAADISPLAEQGFGKYCRVSRKVASISTLLHSRARLLPD
jgi:hypothetical protein